MNDEDLAIGEDLFLHISLKLDHVKKTTYTIYVTSIQYNKQPTANIDNIRHYINIIAARGLKFLLKLHERWYFKVNIVAMKHKVVIINV